MNFEIALPEDCGWAHRFPPPLWPFPRNLASGVFYLGIYNIPDANTKQGIIKTKTWASMFFKREHRLLGIFLFLFFQLYPLITKLKCLHIHGSHFTVHRCADVQIPSVSWSGQMFPGYKCDTGPSSFGASFGQEEGCFQLPGSHTEWVPSPMAFLNLFSFLTVAAKRGAKQLPPISKHKTCLAETPKPCQVNSIHELSSSISFFLSLLPPV